MQLLLLLSGLHAKSTLQRQQRGVVLQWSQFTGNPIAADYLLGDAATFSQASTVLASIQRHYKDLFTLSRGSVEGEPAADRHGGTAIRVPDRAPVFSKDSRPISFLHASTQPKLRSSILMGQLQRLPITTRSMDWSQTGRTGFLRISPPQIRAIGGQLEGLLMTSTGTVRLPYGEDSVLHLPAFQLPPTAL